jgi:hypothetical protein
MTASKRRSCNARLKTPTLLTNCSRRGPTASTDVPGLVQQTLEGGTGGGQIEICADPA